MQGHHASSALAGSRFASLRWQIETGSTNADALALARSGAPDGTVVVADHQTAGRGRLDRGWEAPAGSGLLASVLVRPPLPPTAAHLVTTATGVAAADACRDLSGAPVRLKWPNDLVVEATAAPGSAAGAGKVGGILAEAVVEGAELQAVVVGFGLNVDWPDGPPPALVGTAVALSQLAGRSIDREDLLVAILGGLERWLAVAEGPAPAGLLDRARALSATIGARVRVEQAHGAFEGRALDITDDGHLLVAPDGRARGGTALDGRAWDGAAPDGRAPGGSAAPVEVSVADVVHLRPA